MGFLVGQDLERQIVQAIAGQYGRRLVKRLVDGRLAPAHVVIVHRGQIVMHQRIDMDALDRQADPQRRFA